MNDLYPFLNREATRIDAAPDALRSVLDRARRRQRRQRTSAMALALAIGIAVVTGAFLVSRDASAPLPGSRITVHNVDRLAVSWTAPLGLDPTIATDGARLYAAGNGVVSAFDPSCDAHSADCSPVWQARIGERVSVRVPFDGSLYVVAGQRLLAFAGSCWDAGGTCDPTWVGTITQSSRFGTDLYVSGGVVYVERQGKPNELSAFSTSCEGSCEPLWRTTKYRFGGWGTVGEDAVIVRNRADDALFGFTPECGPVLLRCSPRWTWHAPSGHVGSAVLDGGFVWVDDGAQTFALSTACAGACTPSVKLSSRLLGVSSGLVYTESDVVRVYASACPTTSTCRPVWWGYRPRMHLLSATAMFEGTRVEGDQNGGVAIWPADCASIEHMCRPSLIHTGIDDWIGAPAMADGVLMVSSPFSGDRLLAYDVSCGRDGSPCRPLWTYSTGADGAGRKPPWVGWGSPVIVNGHVYVIRTERLDASSDQTGTLYAFKVLGADGERTTGGP
jgi:hypothetical protein